MLVLPLNVCAGLHLLLALLLVDEIWIIYVSHLPYQTVNYLKAGLVCYVVNTASGI